MRPFRLLFALWAASSGLARADLPLTLPAPESNGYIYLPQAQQKRLSTLDPQLQSALRQFIRRSGNPIAGVIIVDVATGKIRAMAQGRHPAKWGSTSHTALYSGFPAASLFKTAVTAAAIEIGAVEPDRRFGFMGDCAKVQPGGRWLREKRPGRHAMTLRRAYGLSCNGFYALLGVKYLGLNLVTEYARKLGWGSPTPADFAVPVSPMHPPKPVRSSTHTVGRYAAGFGRVGISVTHTAWQYLMLARGGAPIPLTLFEHSPHRNQAGADRALAATTAATLRSIMRHTVQAGTASSAFRRRPYRTLRRTAAGKTGTLAGDAPDGLTTWFAGLMPFDDPEVVVAAVVVTGNRWVIKGPQLAAEAFRQWRLVEQARRNRVSLQKRRR